LLANQSANYRRLDCRPEGGPHRRVTRFQHDTVIIWQVCLKIAQLRRGSASVLKPNPASRLSPSKGEHHRIARLIISWLAFNALTFVALYTRRPRPQMFRYLNWVVHEGPRWDFH
jgi:hypothetical protein